MDTWFSLDGVNIVGWQSGQSAPQGATLASEAEIAAYRTARDAIMESGRNVAPQLVNGEIVIPPDTRPIFSVTCNRAAEPAVGVPVINADGVDSVTVAVKRMVDDVTVDASFTDTLYLTTGSGRTWKMAFVNGIAAKQFSSHVSGRFDVTSRPDFRVVAPFVIIAVE